MAHIRIKNIGPIKDISFDLNKINVFMGPQSSGKSTIAKIISYCSWYEKNAILHTSNRPNFFDELITFHNLEETYFSDDSEIQYESEICKLDFKWKWKDSTQNRVDFHLKEGNVFKNRKISYIPAERNFVTLPGLGKYNETRDNILSFMYDWFLAKKELTQNNSYLMPLPGLGSVAYYFDKETDADKVVIEQDRNIKLNHASSGLRSSIPMLIVFNYIVMSIYNSKRTKTPFEIIDFEDKLQFIKAETIEATENVKYRLTEMKKTLDILMSSVPSTKKTEEVKKSLVEMQEQMANILGYYSDYFYSQVIIEEPELNLFPKTQQELIYYMLDILNKEEKEHQLILTTHSPFILFAINNCMMGGLVRNNIPFEVVNNLPSYFSWINPAKVSVYEIHDGKLKSIQDEDGIIEDNYLNQAYKENSNEYLSMLNYYDNEE
ncbi:MAG: AAA family ATPase [Bacteroides sp.]|nr:AAA family ATPase [Bacteroides sp.]